MSYTVFRKKYASLRFLLILKNKFVDLHKLQQMFVDEE